MQKVGLSLSSGQVSFLTHRQGFPSFFPLSSFDVHSWLPFFYSHPFFLLSPLYFYPTQIPSTGFLNCCFFSSLFWAFSLISLVTNHTQLSATPFWSSQLACGILVGLGRVRRPCSWLAWMPGSSRSQDNFNSFIYLWIADQQNNS